MFRGYEVGAVDYLMKPVIPDVLKSKVAVFVELFRKSERLRESEDKLRRLAAHLISIAKRNARTSRARSTTSSARCSPASRWKSPGSPSA